jgi:glutamate N-acetyltransferase/amino-acid N-acetyltransferase
VRAILINSGCANACTGEKGLQDALISVRSLASLLGVEPNQVLAASTGVIGMPLPTRRVLMGISAAVSALSSRGGDSAARAIMTTDTREKSVAVECRFGGKMVRIGGMAKGSGMIHPNLATMLAVITTDANIGPALLDRLFRRVLERTFNCLTVDGDTSTNDMVAVVANGVSGARIEGRAAAQFEAGLARVCEELVKRIARDGEGATKFVEIEVRGAKCFRDARQVAKSIAHSPLVKTALYGQELNWGRILCAAGYSGIHFDPESVRLYLCGIPIFRAGAPVAASRSRAEKALKSDDIQIRLDLMEGNHEAKVWTCDLTRRYIDINASYIS